jgi:hypothetical protein
MVWSLQSIQDVEDRRLLAGHVALFLQDFDVAQVRLWKGRMYCKKVEEKRRIATLYPVQYFEVEASGTYRDHHALQN